MYSPVISGACHFAARTRALLFKLMARITRIHLIFFLTPHARHASKEAEFLAQAPAAYQP
ncbi:hypothetical protein DI396_08780 [Litorivita pollutaquae]|uniref:Uncharacterized protein n=1 Tax=Litorivita pollutaquae TaxID=2200892 RepID=A0A2V4NS14_9RHOB|nr:hypothetical protein A9Q95_14335 [Rhodobacterales bacterium 59_46_T64]PYC47536.1 hypothetical protein DI396_08780 [Litorivita pollutaquae]